MRGSRLLREIGNHQFISGLDRPRQYPDRTHRRSQQKRSHRFTLSSVIDYPRRSMAWA
jgi:hypothetical protein